MGVRAFRSGISSSVARGLAALALTLSLSFAALAGCGGHSRFALRAPVLRDGDDVPLARMPAADDESEVANALDVILLRPVSHAFLFEPGGEARNVNALDEVPDSTWFTNRVVSPEQVARGPCPDAGPVLPFSIRSSKTTGATPGFVVRDARGQSYMLKLDGGFAGHVGMTTAADAIVSRLYWAVGFNAPCNEVLYVNPGDMRLTARSVEVLSTGQRQPLTSQRLAEVLARAARGAGGTLRLGVSRFIDGEHLGTWRTEGTRADDPNDVVPHEDRRELRGERFLAAWVAHWDSRGPNTYDAFVRAAGAGAGAGGYVLHYFLDFGDSLGGAPAYGDGTPEVRAGRTTVSNVPQIGEDFLALGLRRRSWDEVRVDPNFPDLGYFEAEHFDPMEFSPQTPLVRWARADDGDLGWMARRLAGLGVEHVRAAARAGKLSDPAEEDRLVELLMARRDRVLRAAFARSSPYGNLTLTGGAAGQRLCAADLALAAGVARWDETNVTAEFRQGTRLASAPRPPWLASGDGPYDVCATLPAHFAPADAPDDAPARYATLDLIRTEGGARTVLRAHFYDLGPERGYALVGLERL